MPRVCLIQINVTDMDVATDFYCNKLGFDVLSKKDYPNVVELVQKGIRLVLVKVTKPARIEYPNIAQTLIAIQVDDLTATLEDLKKKGVELVYDTPQKFPEGVYSALRDPFGNVHELIEYR